MKALETCEEALKKAIEETHEAKIDAMVGNIKEMVVMKAADNLLTSGMWGYPSVSYVGIANMGEKVSSDWSDNGAGVWTYAPTGGTIVYIENTYDYTITVSH